MITLKQSYLSPKQLENLTVHPLALPAYRMWIDLKKQTSIANLPHSFQKLLIETTPLLVVEKKNNRNYPDGLLVFGGFQYLDYLSHPKVLNGNAFRYQKIEKYPLTYSEMEIQQQALATILSLLTFQLDAKVGTGHFYLKLQNNNFVEHVIDLSNPSRATLSKWMNVSSSKIKHQAAKFKKGGLK